MRLNLLLCVALASCGDDAVTPDTTPDIVVDTTPDVADTTLDVADTTPDITPDVADTTPDIAADTTPDVAAETSDSEADVVSPGADFTCLAALPSLPLPTGATVTWRARLVDTSSAPRKGVSIRVCADVACAESDGEAVSDTNGVVKVTLPAGSRGYSGIVEVAGEGLQPTLVVLDPPVAESIVTPPDLEILAAGELEAAASAAGVAFQSNLAHARMRMLDCAGAPAAGVGIFFGGSFISDTTKTWYQGAAQGVAATNEGGLAGGFNLAAGETVVEGRVRALDNQYFGEAHLALRSGWLSLGTVHPAQVRADFSCHGVFPLPDVLPQSMGLSIRSSADGSPFVGVSANVCGDDACSPPLSTHTSDSGGVVTFDIPPAGIGSLDLSGGDLFPTRVDLRPPLTTNRPEGTVGGISALTVTAAQSFATLAGTSLDPARAHLLVLTQDCQSWARRNLTISVSSADASSKVYYLAGPLPKPELLATTRDGIAAVLNVPVGPMTLTGYDQDGTPYGKLSLTLHAGVLAYVVLSPTPLEWP